MLPPLSLGIETLGGVMTKLIEKNTTIPTKAQQVFSTAEDNQTAVTVHVLQGERERADGNKSLGRFDLADIPPAQRGTPQIEVAFDIDANGILNVSAKDKATGKEQSIIIKASSGLSDEDIENMVKDAELHAEEDKKFQELVNAKNQAESLVRGAKKSLEDLGEKVSDDERKGIEEGCSALEKALESEDLDEINAKTEQLSGLAGTLAQKAYEEAAAASSGEQEHEAEGDSNDETVVDADFEEVKEEKEEKEEEKEKEGK